jgi:hypothetical protein
MGARRHRDDTATYRELPSYSDRVKAFNATVLKCREYYRVMVELDVRPGLDVAAIARARVRTLEREIAAIRRLGGI